METDPAVEERVDGLARTVADRRRAFEPPSDPPAPDRALELLREGLGPTVSLFVEVRTGGRNVFFDPSTYDRLEAAMNDWLDMYTLCYGVERDGDAQLREAAQLLVDTHDVRAVAEVLTGVPEDR